MTARADDYVSEVIYPDDLIPVEDLEGKFDYYCSIFELIIKMSLMPRQFQHHQQQQQQQQWTMTLKMKVILTSFKGQTFQGAFK